MGGRADRWTNQRPPGGSGSSSSRGVPRSSGRAERLLAGRGGGVHRGLHGPARRQHRDPRPAHTARTFHASVGAVTWVGLSYLLVLVATVAAVGRFADMWGASSSTSTGSPSSSPGRSCAPRPEPGRPDGFRALQAVGAAMLQANSVAIIALAVPDIARPVHRRPGCGPGGRARPRPVGRRPAPRRRWMAPDLPRQRALRARSA